MIPLILRGRVQFPIFEWLQWLLGPFQKRLSIFDCILRDVPAKKKKKSTLRVQSLRFKHWHIHNPQWVARYL